MLKILLPVDGSASAVSATRKLIETLGWYREPPAIQVCTVHLPLPNVPNMGAFVSKDTVRKYYEEESDAMLKTSQCCGVSSRHQASDGGLTLRPSCPAWPTRRWRG